MKKWIAIVPALLALALGAFLFWPRPLPQRDTTLKLPPDFVKTDGTRFRVGDQPFRFAGANVSVMYLNRDRKQAFETLRQAAASGARVVRIWANGEGGPDSPVKALGNDRKDWGRDNVFRFAPDRWNEDAFKHLDAVIAEAGHNGLYVQLCLINWWRDTGGVTQYLYWTGNRGAADDKAPYGINLNEAMAFYSDPTTRRMYKDHVERIVLRRNTVTGRLYRDDPTIFAWELMNEAQAPTWRWQERRAWVDEMSTFVRSLDSNHLITPGIWGYRNSIERRLWIEDHRLPNVDFADIHHYPRDDKDSFDESPTALATFLENRAAAGAALNKPVVVGEFGMSADGYGGFSQTQWYRAYFDAASRLGLGGAMYWILTPDKNRGHYGVTYSGDRDQAVLAEIQRGSRVMLAAAGEETHPDLKGGERYLAPNLFALQRRPEIPPSPPSASKTPQGSIVYRFQAENVASGQFERLGGDKGYVWGVGSGYFEFIVPERERIKRVGTIAIRASLKPVAPWDSRGRIREGDVHLLINGIDCGSQVIEIPAGRRTNVYEWKVRKPELCAKAAQGEKLFLRFSVPATTERPYGLTIAGSPEQATPVELELE